MLRGPPFFCILFAIHPLQTEVVNYVSARSESLAALGILLAALAFLRYRHSAGPVWLVVWLAASYSLLAPRKSLLSRPYCCSTSNDFCPLALPQRLDAQISCLHLLLFHI